MRKLFMLLLAMFMLVSCSSTTVNNAKISGAKILGDGVALFVGEMYVKIPEQSRIDLNCSEEALNMGEDVRLYVEKKLKVKTEFMSLSVGGEIVKIACGLVAVELIPEIVSKNSGNYPCFAKISTDAVKEYIQSELCNTIKF